MAELAAGTMGVSVLLALGASWLLLLPFYSEAVTTTEDVDRVDVELANLVARKEILLRDMEDLEQDYRNSKITEEDYTREKQRLSVDIGGCLTRIDELESVSRA